MIPRLRGRVAEILEPEDMKGQWAFEISVWSLDGHKQIGEAMGPFGPFASKKEAMSALKEGIRLCCEHYEKDLTGKFLGRYLDLRNGGVMRSWEEN